MSLPKKGEMSVPVGVIDDIEVIFLHYPTSEEARGEMDSTVSQELIGTICSSNSAR